MSKIAIVFLLVALVAVCNGARLRREEPAEPNFGTHLKKFADEVKTALSDTNVQRASEQVDTIVKKAKDAGTTITEEFTKWVQQGLKDLEKLTDKTPK